MKHLQPKYITFVIIELFGLISNVYGDRRIGFPDKAEETKTAPCTVLTGSVPGWINGYFLRQLCGGIGPQSLPPGQKIEHMFDCMGMVGAYHIQGGKVTYTSKFYDNKANAIWASSSYKMESCNVSWSTSYSHIDTVGYKNYENKYLDKPKMNPNVMFWKIGGTIAAVTENSEALQFDISTLENQALFDFVENDFDQPAHTVFINNVAHGVYEADGTLWSSVISMEQVVFNAQLYYNAYRLIYKIDPKTGNRTVVSKEKASEQPVNLANCVLSSTTGRWRYQDALFRVGYTHSIVMTDKYLIIPATNLFIDPCFLLPQLRNEVPKPVMKTWLGVDMINKTPSQMVVYRKHDGQIFTFSAMSSMFFMHAINAFEDPIRPSIVHVDLLTYTSGSKSWPTEEYIYRYSMDVASQKIGTDTLNPNAKVMAMEFPQINPAFAGKSYQYIYAVEHPFGEQSQIVKLNANSKTLTGWTPPTNVYVSEPAFLQSPGKTVEDEGVLLVPAFNSTSKKGLLFFIDALSMKEMGSVEAPVLTPFGLHNRFFSANELRSPGNDGSRSSYVSVFTFLSALGLVILGRAVNQTITHSIT